MGQDTGDTYVKVFHWLMDSAKLKPTEALCYAHILSFSLSGNWCFYSLSTFAKKLNVDRKTVLSVLKTLQDRQLIVKLEYWENNTPRRKYFARYLSSCEFEKQTSRAPPGVV